MDWQPIETAPKDGTVIDLWIHYPEHDRNARAADVRWNADVGEWQHGNFHLGQYMHRPTPTHWMPLPPPPLPLPTITEQQEEDSGGEDLLGICSMAPKPPV